MSMLEKRLSRNDERECLNILKTMQAEGISVEIPQLWLEHSRPLDVRIAPPPISEAFERPSGGVSYAVWVRLRSRMRCMIEDASIVVPWDDQLALDSPDEKNAIYQVGSQHFRLKTVLNLRIENTLKFARRGEVVEGVILATGLWRFPEGYVTGQSVPFKLYLYDQYGDAMEEQGNLFVQRARRSDRKDEGKSEDLFGNPRFRGAVAEQPSHVSGGFPPRQFIQLAGGMEVSIPGASRYICTDAAKEDEVCGQ